MVRVVRQRTQRTLIHVGFAKDDDAVCLQLGYYAGITFGDDRLPQSVCCGQTGYINVVFNHDGDAV